MRNPFRERNLMSAKDNPYMCAYRRNPEKVREIIETAHHTTWPTRNEVKEWIKLMTSGKEDKIFFTFGGGALGLGFATTFFCGPLSLYELFTGYSCHTLPAIGGMLFSGLAGVTWGYHYWNKCNQRRNEYLSCKNDADKNLRHRRVEGTNQLEFLFD